MGKIFIVGEVVYWDHKCCELDDYDDYETRMYKIAIAMIVYWEKIVYYEVSCLYKKDFSIRN